jgi:hypothetical protein
MTASFPEHLPHAVIPTPDGNVHVVPCVVLERIAAGDMPLRKLQDWRLIVRGIIGDWLRMQTEGGYDS